MSNDNVVHYLNADSKILNIPDKIWHYKTTDSLVEREQSVSKKLTEEVMGKENLANGQGRFYLQKKKNPLDHDSQIMADLQTAAKKRLNTSLTNCAVISHLGVSWHSKPMSFVYKVW